MRRLPLGTPLIGLMICLSCACQENASLTTGSDLQQAYAGFTTPQDTARTKLWWFHGRYPASHEGMTDDLEAFRDAGIGGVVFYDQVHGDPDPGTPQSMTPQWWADVYHAVREAHRLGLSIEMHVGNGFVAGGEWITPELAMKRVETVDTVVQGGRHIDLRLPHPQNRYHYYRDIRLMAIPEPEPEPVGTITTSLKGWNAETLFTGQKTIDIPATDSAVLIDIDYGQECTLRSMSYLIGSMGKATTSATNVPAPPGEVFVGTGYRTLPPVGQLEWSNDGQTYHKVCDIKPRYRGMETYTRKTLSFLPVRARYFRLRLEGWDGASKGQPLKLGGIAFSTHAKVNEVEYKAGYISDYIEKSMASPAYTTDDVVDPDHIIDLTSCMDPEGHLSWDAPEGQWRLLRICQVPSGGRVKHYRQGHIGQRLECDKMSVEAAQVQWQNYMGCILDSLQSQGLGGYVSGMLMDSHEAGAQNWTDDLLTAFQQLRGYDLTPYLPILAGYVVGNIDRSEAVLYDFRQTLADLISQRYYGTMDSLCHTRGIILTAQATGNGQNIVAIPIEAKGQVDKPQGEFWPLQPNGNYDIKEASSAAHLYGRQIASGEAFTDSRLSHMPNDIKNMADAAYCMGINEFAVCASSHQPTYIPAGNPAGRCYSTFTRCNTWWPVSRPLWDYQARVSNTLRQGRPVVDICLLLGNNAPTRMLTHRLPHIPAGYDFDACTEQTLMDRMTVENHLITLPTGQTYQMLVLPRSGELTLDALRKINQLVQQGANVYGPRPTGSPSARDIGHETEYQQLVDQLFDKHKHGRGHLYQAPNEEEVLQQTHEDTDQHYTVGISLAQALRQAGIQPDIDGISLASHTQNYAYGSGLYFTHRRVDDADIYYINNHADTLRNDTYTFRSTYRHAYYWDPLTGQAFRLARQADNSIHLPLKGREAGFVVLTNQDDSTLPLKPICTTMQTLQGPWTLSFTPYGKQTKTITQAQPTDYKKSSDADLEHFSGTATYSTTFTLQPTSGQTILLQLPPNPCVTVVVINNQYAGTIFASPWQADLTPYLQPGDNTLQLHATNSWTNRLIFDRQQTPQQRQIPHPEWFELETKRPVPAGINGEVQLFLVNSEQ